MLSFAVHRRRLRLLVPVCAALLTSVGARCQEAAIGATAEAASAPSLPAVTVTGERAPSVLSSQASAGVLGERALIDTPFSVNVLNRRLLDNQQAAHYGDYLKNDPSVTVGNVPVGFTTLRGFPVGTSGYLYDGLAGNVGISDGRWQIEGIDRIEVLKGPSAFLYGLGSSTSLGGTFNYVPKRPTDAPVRSATVGYTSRSLWSATADLGDRFGADRQFGVRANVGLRDGEQAIQGADWGHRAATLALDWRAAPGVLVTAGAEYANNHFPRLQPFFVVAPGVPVPRAPDASRSIAQPWDDFRAIATSEWLRADVQLATDWSVSAQAMASRSWRPRTQEARFGFITDAEGSTTLFGSEDASNTTGSAGQLLLHGKLTTGPLAHQLTIGATGTREASRSASVPAGDGFYGTNLYAPVDAPQPAAAAPFDVPLNQKARSSSVLVSDIVALDGQWSVLLGARHAKLTLTNIAAGVGSDNTLSKTSPIGALMWKPQAHLLAYVNYAEGLEQGGVITNTTVRLPPVKTRQVELGTKLDLDALNVTAALFDLRKPLEDLVAGTQTGEQRHRGLELTATGNVTPALEVVGGLMWLDPSVRGTGNAAVDGKRPAGVASFTANLWADWRLDALPGWFVNAGVFHAGKQSLDGGNAQVVPKWTRLDVGARYEARIDGLRTAWLLNVENAANRNYWAGAQSGILTLADPLTVKATARLDF